MARPLTPTAPAGADPTMPRRMPERVERELREALANWRVQVAPIDVYTIIRDELAREQEP